MTHRTYLRGLVRISESLNKMPTFRTARLFRPLISLPFLVSLFLLLMFIGQERVFAQDRDQLRRQVLSEVPSAYKRFREYSVKLQGTVDIVDTINDRDKGTFKKEGQHIEVKMNKDCAYWLVQWMNEDRVGGEVVVNNPSYTFQLKRKNQNARWYLSALDSNANPGGLARLRPVRELTEDCLLCAYKVYGVTITDILAEIDDFRIRRIASVQKDGVGVVEVEFDSSHQLQPKEGKPFFPIQGGMLLLDPSHAWRVLEYNLRGEWGNGKGSISASCSYTESTNGMPIPHKVNRTTRYYEPRSIVAEQVIDFDMKEVADPPSDEQFTLTAFGLPEPSIPRAVGRFRQAIVVVVIGVVLLIIAFWARRLAQLCKK